jgi:alpha-D-ribose 1-methylphosphonate 5-triphosphate synthase subunit PhnH
MGVALRKGLADPVFDSQRVFRAVMNAIARPGSIIDLDIGLDPAPMLTAELAAVALALLDRETPVWLDAVMRDDEEITAFLRFHTGALITAEPREAAFALVSRAEQLPALTEFALGTPDFPDRSTTVVIAVDALSNRHGFELRGPGINGLAHFDAIPLRQGFEAEWAVNREIYPRGVDLVLVAPGAVAAMPRTVEIAGRT